MPTPTFSIERPGHEVGSRKSEVGSRELEVGSRKYNLFKSDKVENNLNVSKLTRIFDKSISNTTEATLNGLTPIFDIFEIWV